MTRRAILLRSAALMSVFALAACDTDDPTLPVSPDAGLNRAASGDQPFYYHQGEKYYLDVDPGRLVVSSAGAAPEGDAAIREVLRASGVPVSSTAALPGVPGHRVVTLGATQAPVLASAVGRLRADPRIRFAAHAYKSAQDRQDVLLVDRVIVQFRNGVTASQVDSLNRALGTYVVRAPQPDSGYTWHLLGYPRSASSDPLRTAAVLDRHPLVEWADPDKLSGHRRMGVPSDPYFPYQFYFQNSHTRNGIPVDINIVPAWDLTLGTEATRVAIIDDGVDIDHYEFYYRNSRRYDSFGGAYCADGVTFSSAGHPCPSDSHGTAVAGVLMAPHNSVGVAGGAPNTYLMFARIFKDGVANTSGAIANTITWAWYTATADVISNSWGGGAPSNSITSAIHNAVTQGRAGKGTVVVFAVGNSSRRYGDGYVAPVAYPASLSDVIAVASINRYGDVAGYSNGGSQVDIAAIGSVSVGPGCGYGDIVSTDLINYDGCNDGPNGDINHQSSFGGTSAAAPQVAAVAALLLTREPGLTYSSVRSRLFANADYWGAASAVGAGKLNAYRTLVPPTGGGGDPPPGDCNLDPMVPC